MGSVPYKEMCDTTGDRGEGGGGRELKERYFPDSDCVDVLCRYTKPFPRNEPFIMAWSYGYVSTRHNLICVFMRC